MITYKYGNIFNENHGIICNGVNCKGAYGSGLAGQITKLYPKAREDYLKFNNKTLGQVCYSNVDYNDTLWIAHCFTQENYGADGKRYADTTAIAVSLSSVLNRNYNKYLVFLPLIGCGLGGLDWKSDVKPVYEMLGKIYDFTVYVPEGFKV